VKVAKLTDMQIKAWVRAGERFEGRSDGNSLYLRYREVDRVPVWRFRYKFAGKARAMVTGAMEGYLHSTVISFRLNPEDLETSLYPDGQTLFASS